MFHCRDVDHRLLPAVHFPHHLAGSCLLLLSCRRIGRLAGASPAYGRVVSQHPKAKCLAISTPHGGRESRDVFAPESYLLLLEIPATHTETGVRGGGSGGGGLKRLDSGEHGFDQD